jgi:hypothetical protein
MQKLWKRGAGILIGGGFALAASGCFVPGGGGFPGNGTLRVEVLEPLGSRPAQPFDFDADTYYVPHGEVDVSYIAPTGSVIPHTLKLRAVGGSAAIPGTIDLLIPGGPTDAASGTFEVPAGKYELYCDITNPQTGVSHAQLGMTAVLNVL